MALAPAARDPTAEALALRVAELSSVLKQQRDEIDEKDSLLEHNRKLVRDHEEIIRMQEAQLLERDAQLQSQNAEIRALRRQHTMDAEALRAAQQQLQGRLRPSGSMGLSQRRTTRGGPSAASPSRASEAEASAPPPLSPGSPVKRPTTPNSTRKQLQQAIADKVVLVRALHQLTTEMAQARAEAKQYAAVSERSLSTAWRLGQLGQLGLALLEVGDEATVDDLPFDHDERAYLEQPRLNMDPDAMLAEDEHDDTRWEAMMGAPEAVPPTWEDEDEDDEESLLPRMTTPLSSRASASNVRFEDEGAE